MKKSPRLASLSLNEVTTIKRAISLVCDNAKVQAESNMRDNGDSVAYSTVKVTFPNNFHFGKEEKNDFFKAFSIFYENVRLQVERRSNIYYISKFA